VSIISSSGTSVPQSSHYKTSIVVTTVAAIFSFTRKELSQSHKGAKRAKKIQNYKNIVLTKKASGKYESFRITA